MGSLSSQRRCLSSPQAYGKETFAVKAARKSPLQRREVYLIMTGMAMRSCEFYSNDAEIVISFTPFLIGYLKGHCHAIWQLYKKLGGVFASPEF